LHAEKEKIAIIGAGKIAYSLTNALVKSNFNIQSVFSKNQKSAEDLAEIFGIKNFSNDLNDISEDINIFFLTIPDNQIQNTARQISELKINFNGKLFVHFSGALSSDELEVLKEKGSDTASFHIMQSFPSKRVVNFNNLTAAIESDSKIAEKYLFGLSEKINLKPFQLLKEDKINYHLSGVFSSNLFVGNLFSASEVMNLNNSNYPEFNQLNLPIVKTTIDNIKKNGLDNSLSGPLQRGEVEVIKKHIENLKSKTDNSFNVEGKNIFLLNYICQSITILKMLENKKNGINQNQKDILNLLIVEFNEIIKK